MIRNMANGLTYMRKTTSSEATKQLAATLSPYLQAGDVIVLSGDLGAGKTQFVQGVAAGLGVRDQVCVHQSVITELALGNLKNRSFFLKMLERLMIVRNVDDQGVRHLVEERRLWGRGLSAVDAALLASVVVTPGVSLWTRDKRLRQAARDVGVLAELD